MDVYDDCTQSKRRISCNNDFLHYDGHKLTYIRKTFVLPCLVNMFPSTRIKVDVPTKYKLQTCVCVCVCVCVRV